MPVNRKIIFDAVKQLRAGKPYVLAEVNLLDKAIDAATGENFAAQSAPKAPVVPVPTGQFKLSKTSTDRLAYLLPKLRQCVELAITYSEVDFGVNQTIRTIEQQKAAVAAGNSRTMQSKHLRQADGWAHAVDLLAYVNGKASWDFALYPPIAFAMDKAATELGIAGHVRWGCAWDRVLSDFGGDLSAYMAEVKAYQARHAGSDLLDGPHFEWVV